MHYNLLESGIIQYSDINKISLLRLLELTHYYQHGKLQETLASIDDFIDRKEQNDN